MADILLDLGIDLTGVTSDVKKATATIKQEFAKVKPKINLDGKVAQNSINQLTGSFTRLNKEVRMTEGQLKQAMAQMILSGQKGSTAYNKLEKELRETTQQAKLLDKAMDKVNADLNQTSAKAKTAGSGLKNMMSGIGGGLLAGGGIGVAMIGIQKLQQGIRDVINLGTEYQDSMADFSAITSVAGDGLDIFSDKAMELSNKFGGKATDQITTFKMLLSKLGLELKESPEAVGMMTEAVNTLAKAAGLDASQAMDALGEGMLQFNIDMGDPINAAKEMTKQMNTMAAASQVGAAEVPEVAESLKIVGATANNLNQSFEETVAAIEVLAKAGLKGAEAGTKLRGVFINLAKVTPQSAKAIKKYGIDLKDVQKTLSEEGLQAAMAKFGKGMESIADPVERASLLAQVFGKQNQAAAGALMTHIDTFKDYKDAITDTNIGTEQAATKMATFSEVMGRLKSNFSNLGIGIFKALTPLINQLSGMASGTSGVFESIGNGIKQVGAFIKGFVDSGGLAPYIAMWERVKSIFSLIGNLINSVIEPFKTLFGVTDEGTASAEGMGSTFGFLVEVFTAMMKPLQWVIDALNWLIVAVTDVLTVTAKLTKFLWEKLYEGVLKPIADFLTNVFTAAWNGTISAIKSVSDTVIGVWNTIKSYFSGFITAINNFIQPVKDAIKSLLDWFSGAFDTVYNAVSSAWNAIAGVLGEKEIPPIEVEVKTKDKKGGGLGDGTEDGTEDLAVPIDKATKKAKTLKERLEAVTKELTKLSRAGKEDTKEYESKLKLAKELTNEIRLMKLAADKVKLAIEFDPDAIGLNNSTIAKINTIGGEFAKELENVVNNTPFKYNPIDIEVDRTAIQYFGDLIINSLNSIQDKIKGIFTKEDLTEQTNEYKEEYDKQATELKRKLSIEEISYKDYRKELAAQSLAAMKHEKELQKQYLSGWKRTQKAAEILFEQMAKSQERAISKNVKEFQELSKAGEDTSQKTKDIYAETGVMVGTLFASSLAAQDSFLEASAKATLAGLKAVAPVIIAEIMGKSFAEDPILGAVIGGLATAAFVSLISVAESSIGGAEGGVVGLTEGTKGRPGRTDTIPMMLAKSESVINKQGTLAKGNAEFFTWVNRTGGSIEDYQSNKMELKAIENAIRSTKLVESYHNNEIVINDNRAVEIKTRKWGGR